MWGTDPKRLKLPGDSRDNESQTLVARLLLRWGTKQALQEPPLSSGALGDLMNTPHVVSPAPPPHLFISSTRDMGDVIQGPNL